MADIFRLFDMIKKESATTGNVTHLIVGLGNPGAKYDNTRHNVGFTAVDRICEMRGCDCKRLKFRALTGETAVGGARVLLMKPQTYMNLSGEAVSEASAFYKIPPENVIVIVDDVNLDVGRMRIRCSGSAGGHNGLKSIIAHLDSENFPRVRVGVGKKPNPEYDLADWVLGKFSESDREKLSACYENALGAAELLIQNKVDEAMSKYNGTGGK